MQVINLIFGMTVGNNQPMDLLLFGFASLNGVRNTNILNDSWTKLSKCAV